VKTLGISLGIVLLLGSLVFPINVIPAFATAHAAPHPPTQLNATAVTGTKIFLVWNAPINATQDNVTGYKLESSPACSSSFHFLANTTAPVFLSTGLINGTCYQFRVSAINSIGISNQSNIATATTLSAPSAPTNLVASAVSSSKINLYWNAPANNGGTQITSYNILKSLCAVGTITITNTHNSNTTYSDTGLVSNTCYEYNIEAVNAIGTSPSTPNATATTNATLQNHVPGKPTGLSVIVLSNTALKLAWHKPSNNGGSQVTGYLIQRNGTNFVSNTFTNQTIFTDSNLMPNHRETYRVAAWNNAGLGAFSNEDLAFTNSSYIIPGIYGNTTITINGSANLGQLISDFVHKRNALLQQQRAELVAAIHECHTKIKNATDDNRTQIHDDCKAKVKQLREKYKESRKLLRDEFKKLREIFKLQIQNNVKLNATGTTHGHNEDIKESEKETEKHSNENGNLNLQIQSKIKLNDSDITHGLGKEIKQAQKELKKHSDKESKNKGKSEHDNKEND